MGALAAVEVAVVAASVGQSFGICLRRAQLPSTGSGCAPQAERRSVCASPRGHVHRTNNTPLAYQIEDATTLITKGYDDTHTYNEISNIREIDTDMKALCLAGRRSNAYELICIMY